MFYLALVAMLHLTELQPSIGIGFTDRGTCLAAAHEANKLPDINDEAGKAMGLRFVCLTIVVPGLEV